MSTTNAKSLPEITLAAKNRAKGLTWATIDADRSAAVASTIKLTGFDDAMERKFEGIMNVSVSAYARKRAETSFWKLCEGKQVLNNVACLSGYSGAPALVLATYAAWERDGAQLPEELIAFRSYLSRR
jgi:hypothetical protein